MNFFERPSVNLDITHRCTLQCPHCARQESNHWKSGWDMSDHAFDVILNHFDKIVFCGQFADPIFHPKFPEFLEKCYKLGKTTWVHTAASHKPLQWYYDCFKANPKARWIFGIDGLPEDSHKYRVNQDGKKLFDIMCKSTDILSEVEWMYIAFAYNENDIETCRQLADNIGVDFSLVYSTRWSEDDPLKPSQGRYL